MQICWFRFILQCLVLESVGFIRTYMPLLIVYCNAVNVFMPVIVSFTNVTTTVTFWWHLVPLFWVHTALLVLQQCHLVWQRISLELIFDGATKSRIGLTKTNALMHWSRSPFGQQILSDSSDDYWKLTTSSCISVLTNSAVTVFNLVFTIHTFCDYCNASRSGFVYRGH